MNLLAVAGMIAVADASDSVRTMTGTGFYVSDGTIVTCCHVVEGASKVEIVNSNGIRETADVIYQDKVSDVAILHVGGYGKGTLPLADPEGINVMDPIVVVGFPMAATLGTEISATVGHINAIRRTPTGPRLQVDAAMNPGNSGGPILSGTGEVVGICVASARRTSSPLSGTVDPQLINFGVPSTIVRLDCEKCGIFQTGGNNTRVLSAKTLMARATAATVLIYTTRDTSIRSEVILPRTADDGKVGRWVSSLVDSMNLTDPDKQLSYFGDTVDYKDLGALDGQSLANVLKQDRLDWPQRNMRLERFGVLQKNPQDDTMGVAFVYSFAMSRPGGRSQSGRMQAEVLIDSASRSPNIVYYRESFLQ